MADTGFQNARSHWRIHIAAGGAGVVGSWQWGHRLREALALPHLDNLNWHQLLLLLPQYPAIATLTQSNLEFHMAVVKAGSLQFLPHPSCY